MGLGMLLFIRLVSLTTVVVSLMPWICVASSALWRSTTIQRTLKTATLTLSLRFTELHPLEKLRTTETTSLLYPLKTLQKSLVCMTTPISLTNVKSPTLWSKRSFQSNQESLEVALLVVSLQMRLLLRSASHSSRQFHPILIALRVLKNCSRQRTTCCPL